MTSLLNVMLSEDVERLLRHELLDDLPDAERAFSREKTAAIIHAALWAHSARSSSTASAYAINSLFEAIGLETWTFKKRPAPETPAAPRTCSWERRGDHFNCHVCGSMSRTTQSRDAIIADCQKRPTANRGVNDAK